MSAKSRAVLPTELKATVKALLEAYDAMQEVGSNMSAHVEKQIRQTGALMSALSILKKDALVDGLVDLLAEEIKVRREIFATVKGTPGRHGPAKSDWIEKTLMILLVGSGYNAAQAARITAEHLQSHGIKGSNQRAITEGSIRTKWTRRGYTVGTIPRLYDSVKRGEEACELEIASRSMPSRKLLLSHARDFSSWTCHGAGDSDDQTEITDAQAEIKKVLIRASEPMTPKAIAEAVGKAPNAVSMTLAQMVDRGLIEKVGYGKYAVRVYEMDDF